MIETLKSQSAYTNGSGVFGCRLSKDRRYWLAWASISNHDSDIYGGVMDDFGNIVPANPDAA